MKIKLNPRYARQAQFQSELKEDGKLIRGAVDNDGVVEYKDVERAKDVIKAKYGKEWTETADKTDKSDKSSKSTVAASEPEKTETDKENKKFGG